MRIKVAGLVCDISNADELLVSLCRDFLTDENPEVSIHLPPLPPLEQSIALLREVNARLMEKDTFLFHASALEIHGKAVMFTAHSGTGKSTHAALWRKAFGDKVTMINDDKPFLRFQGKQITVCGSPWMGKHGLGGNIEAPLAALCFISRSDTDSISPLSPKEALPLIFDQIPRVPSERYMSRLLELLDLLLTNTPLYHLKVTKSVSAAEVAYQGMIGELL